MNKVISSFVILSNCLNTGIDSINAFIPFVIRLFCIKNYGSVNIETICRDFADEYGLQIPRHPMETILNRMKPRYITKESNNILIKQAEIRVAAETINFEDEYRKYNWLLEHFIDFCRNYSTPVEVSRDEADNLIINLLKSHDDDIIFAVYTQDESNSLIPEIQEIDNADKIFLINKFVNDLLQNGGEYAEYLINSAVGHKYASVILYREFSNIRGKGACANYYLDVGILFDLFGINKSFRKKAAEDLLAVLRSKGSKLWVFRHNYEEFMRIIESTLSWIENDTYDSAKASRTLQYFKDEGYGITEVHLFISQIDEILSKNEIRIAPQMDPNLDQSYQIDRNEVQAIILDVYNSRGNLFDLEDREETLELDITSIEKIYKLRRGNTPINFNDTTHVFLTTNTGLAYASNKFEQEVLDRGFFTIPPVLTDTFVGTFIWVQEPTQLAEEFNRSKMISYTNAALQPRANLIRKYAQVVGQAQKNSLNPISNESATLLLTSSLTRKLLAEKTLGDPNRITSQTPYEILSELRAELTAIEKDKTDAIRREADEISTKKEEIQGKYNDQIDHLEKIINKIAFCGRWLSVILLFALALLFFGIEEFKEPKTLPVKIINYVYSVFSAVFGVAILFLGKKIEKWIYGKLSEILIKKGNG